MKGVCFRSVGEVETLEMADPEIQQPTDAILKVTMAGLCGSDLHLFHGREVGVDQGTCLLYTSPSPRDRTRSRMPSSA